MAKLSQPTHIWFDEAVRPWGEARVHVWTETVLRAASVFEGLRGYWHPGENRHHFVHLSDHMARLADSVRVLRLPRAVSREECLGAIEQLLLTLDYREDIYLRPTIFLREGRYSVGGSADDCGFFMPIFPSARSESITTGQSCQVSSWRRSDDSTAPPRVKAAANYYNLRLARLEATSNGFDEAILLNTRGQVAETGGSSVFVVRNGRVATPDLGSSILESLTRRSAIELLSGELGMPVEERPVDRTELYLADEIFLAGTLAEITPVTTIDALPVGQGEPGDVTRSLEKLYLDACTAGSDDQRGWLTPGPVLA